MADIQATGSVFMVWSAKTRAARKAGTWIVLRSGGDGILARSASLENKKEATEKTSTVFIAWSSTFTR